MAAGEAASTHGDPGIACIAARGPVCTHSLYGDRFVQNQLPAYASCTCAYCLLPYQATRADSLITVGILMT